MQLFPETPLKRLVGVLGVSAFFANVTQGLVFTAGHTKTLPLDNMAVTFVCSLSAVFFIYAIRQFWHTWSWPERFLWCVTWLLVVSVSIYASFARIDEQVKAEATAIKSQNQPYNLALSRKTRNENDLKTNIDEETAAKNTVHAETNGLHGKAKGCGDNCKAAKQAAKIAREKQATAIAAIERAESAMLAAGKPLPEININSWGAKFERYARPVILELVSSLFIGLAYTPKPIEAPDLPKYDPTRARKARVSETDALAYWWTFKGIKGHSPTNQELVDGTGCAKGSASRWRKKWRDSGQMDEAPRPRRKALTS